jgi:nicotinate-nucleotide pyrophosphorylase (carboxylating)
MSEPRPSRTLRDPFAEDLGPPDGEEIQQLVQATLREDLGSGDLSAALVPTDLQVTAQLLLRESAILCGQAWFDACFRALEPRITIAWNVPEGRRAEAASVVAEIDGAARAILSAERSALNLLQTLSGTATETAHLVALLGGSHTRLLDTRKTLPGLRSAQKYAVRCGGGYNHRLCGG